MTDNRMGQSPVIKIIALTDAGKSLGQYLQSKLANAELCYKPKPFAQVVQQAFADGHPLLFICATGIVMRTLSPVLVSKHDDPPVLVMDEQGQFVISLLSGHEGGANQWASDVATIVNAKPVITTANAYLKPIYTVGMGCERHCPESVMHDLLSNCLRQADLTINQIASINSIDIKADERGLISLSHTLDKPFLTWDTHALGGMESLLSVKSDYVFKTVGVYGVAESAALIAAHQASDNNSPELVLNKQKNAQATCAIARAFCEN